MSEVGSGRAADRAVDAETTHGLVVRAEAGGRVSAHDVAYDLIVLVDGEHAGPEVLASAAGKDAEMVWAEKRKARQVS